MSSDVQEPNIYPDKALILFADVIDSSKYSSFLGVREYATEILRFQKTFKNSADQYFPENKSIEKYYYTSTRGDEGIVFAIDHSIKPYQLILQALKFAFELKALMELGGKADEKDDKRPRKMKIAIGIHYGDVAVVAYNDIVNRIEGYAINYAKRIESVSRIGRYSKIFLSKDAKGLMTFEPMIFKKHISDLKGIQNDEDVYEVQSAFFPDLFLDDKILNSEQYIKDFEDDKLDVIEEPWLKGFILSILDKKQSQVPKEDEEKAREYLLKKSNLAWRDIAESDPIILLTRGILCASKEKYTSCLEYFKYLIKNYTEFIHAKFILIKLFDKHKFQASKSELIFARDIAQEIVDHYEYLLKDDEPQSFKCFIIYANSEIDKK